MISLMKDNGTDGGKNHRFPKPDDQEATQSLRFLAAAVNELLSGFIVLQPQSSSTSADARGGSL